MHMVLWGVSNKWSNLIDSDRWKLLAEDDVITKRFIQRNATHLSMSGESPFTRGPLADKIGSDEDGAAAEEILQGNFERDLSGLDEATASTEMKSFIQGLRITISCKTRLPFTRWMTMPDPTTVSILST